MILLLGLTPSERTYLAALLPQRTVLDINSLDDFASKFPEVVARRESIVCSASQYGFSLMSSARIGSMTIVRDEVRWLRRGIAFKGISAGTV